jgi:hypothetical protein
MQPFRTKGLFSQVQKNPAFGPGVDDPAARMGRELYLEGLRSDAPINWLSSHLKENQSDFGAIYIAIKALKAQASAARMKFYRWHPDAKMGGDEEEKQYLPRQHEICRFFNYPNKWDSGRKMTARLVEQYCLTGTGLGWRVDEGTAFDKSDDRPEELWSVATGLYTAIPMSPMYPNGAYRIMPFFPGPMAQLPGTWQAGGVTVPADQMLVWQATHPLTYKEGLSPLAACASELDTINGIGRARNSIIRRAPVPSGVLEMDTNTQWPDKSQLNRLTQQLFNYIGGADRAGRPAIFGPGMTWKPFEMQGIELPWGDTWDQLLCFVFAIFGVTKSMVGMNEDTSYAALYATLKQFNLFTLCPLLQDLADAYDRQIIHKFWGVEYGMEFETQQVSDDDLLEKQLSNDLQAGVRKMNEWRRLRKLMPIEGPEGDKFLKASGKDQQAPDAKQLEGMQNGAAKNDEPKNPAEAVRPRNIAGSGSLPPRIAAMLGPRTNGNGKH